MVKTENHKQNLTRRAHRWSRWAANYRDKKPKKKPTKLHQIANPKTWFDFCRKLETESKIGQKPQTAKDIKTEKPNFFWYKPTFENRKKKTFLIQTLKCYCDENHIFSVEAILRHKQVAYMRRKMLFTIFKYLFLFQRYSSF